MCVYGMMVLLLVMVIRGVDVIEGRGRSRCMP